MDLNAAIELAGMFPNTNMTVVYTHVWKLCSEAAAQGFPLRISAASLREGHGGCPPLNMKRETISKALVALANLELIVRSMSRDTRLGQTIEVVRLSPERKLELVTAFLRLREHGPGGRIYRILQGTYVKSQADWALCEEHLRGKTFAASALLAPRFIPEQLLFGLSTELRTMSEPGPLGPGHGPTGPGPGPSRLDGNTALPKEGIHYRDEAAAAAGVDGEENMPPSKQGDRRRAAQDAKAAENHQRAMKVFNDMKDGKDVVLSTGAIGKPNAEKKAATVTTGAKKKRTPTQKAKARKGSKAKAICVLDWPSWKEAGPLLEELYGENSIVLSEEERDEEGLITNRAGVVRASECDPTAYKLLVLCHDGFRQVGVKWGFPDRDFAALMLRSYKYFLVITGEKAGTDGYRLLRMLAGWSRGHGGNAPAEGIFRSLAGFAYRIVDARMSGKIQFAPTALEWRDVFLKQRRKSAAAFDKAQTQGLVKGALDFLDALPPGPLLTADLGSAALVEKKSPWQVDIPNVG